MRDALHHRAVPRVRAGRARALRERFKLDWMLKVLKTVTPVLVILGVILSTLHQSSLGSLFLILPDKLHPLWYTPMLPVLFFVSALAAGLGDDRSCESWFSQAGVRQADRDAPARPACRGPRSSCSALYLVAAPARPRGPRRALARSGRSHRVSVMFLIEVGLGVLVPMVLLAFERFRRSPQRLAAAQGLVVLGFIFHRLNVSRHVGGGRHRPDATSPRSRSSSSRRAWSPSE